MATGKVKFFNEAKGFGFISNDDGSGDVFMHRTDLKVASDLLSEGDVVSFDIEQGRNGKTKAVGVNLAAAAPVTTSGF